MSAATVSPAFEMLFLKLMKPPNNGKDTSSNVTEFRKLLSIVTPECQRIARLGYLKVARIHCAISSSESTVSSSSLSSNEVDDNITCSLHCAPPAEM